jgi:iron complex outermembrane receptor protein
VDIKLGVSKSLLLSLALPLIVAFPQQSIAQDDEQVLEEIITTGTRARERSVSESMVPIDVISAEDFSNQGDTDLSNLLRNIVPSYNVNSQPISDAATIVRPANMRGLAPDHTLVLINGKRRHRAAVIYWLGNGVSDGAQGPDISAIPSIALKQVEVLRDGASAQYGSDAIAGVMNFILKDGSDGGSIEAKYGEYSEGDGTATSVAGNIGLPLGSKGFANLSFEYGNTDPTDRSVQRNDAAALIAAGNTFVKNPAQVWGSPEIEDEIKLFGNFGLELDNDMQLYGHANYVSKTVTGGFYFRNPNTRSAVFSADGGETLLIGDMLQAAGGAPGAANCPVVSITNDVPDAAALAQVFADPNCFSFQEMFPGGFTPQFGGDVTDYAFVGGIKGETDGGLYWDASASYGMNEVDFFISNTINASLGPVTPTTFDPGLYKQEEFNLNFDASYAISDTVNLGVGAEYRDETFEIGIGQVESYEIGPLADQGFSAASNGFSGFSDIAAGSWSRANTAVYADIEVQLTEDLMVGVATRYEDFDDFGKTMNGKIAAHYNVSDTLSLRTSLSSGFRAPTPGQSNAFNVSTEFDLAAMELVNNGTIPSSSAVAAIVGGQPLTAEKSTNFSVGAIFDVGAVSITADYFNIDMTDRITPSRNFSLTPQQVIDLIAEGVTSAGNLQNFRFFTNDFDTQTSGIDIVATTAVDMIGGVTDISVAFNYTNTDVTKYNPETLDDTRIQELQDGLPETRWSVTGNHINGDWRVLGRLSYYDDWFDSEDGQVYDGKLLVDAEAAYHVNDSLSLVLGAQNLLDQTPDDNPGAANGVGNKYSQFSPFGFNGRYWYARVKYDF